MSTPSFFTKDFVAVNKTNNSDLAICNWSLFVLETRKQNIHCIGWTEKITAYYFRDYSPIQYYAVI